MRLNEFQANVVRDEQITGIIDTEIADAIERSVADMLISAARLAQAAGSDLDSIAHAAVKRIEKANSVQREIPTAASENLSEIAP